MSRSLRKRDQDYDYSWRQFFNDTWVYLRPYAGRVRWGFALRILADIASVAEVFLFGLLVDRVVDLAQGGSLETFLPLIAIWGGLQIFKTTASTQSRVIGYRAFEDASGDALQASARHTTDLDLAWHVRENTGNTLKKLMRGSRAITNTYRTLMQRLTQVIVTTVGSIIVLLKLEPILAGVMAGFMVIYFLLSRYFNSRGERAAHAANKTDEKINGLAFEMLSNIRTMAVLDVAPALLRKFGKSVKRYVGDIYDRIFWYQNGGQVRNVFARLVRIGVAVLVVWGIIQGNYEVGLLVIADRYFNRAWDAVAGLAFMLPDLVVKKLSYARFMAIMNEPVSIKLVDDKLKMPEDWQTITLKNVSFAYEDQDPVLRKLSLTINRGERIGIVGLSGAGKSTLFKLLLKEYENYTGDILIDDTPLKQIRTDSYFSSAAVVLQDTEVFNFSLRENITLARTTVKDKKKQLKKALRVAHVDEIVKRLPKKERTLIGEKGVKLSGGEKQRLGIARAIYKQPDVLFMDEATSNLDVESERKIKDALQNFFQEVTAVVIAHRLTTIKEMDRIIVMQAGKIIEEGSFRQLMRKKGRFYKLWQQQKLE